MLKKMLKNLPKEAGIYQFLDKNGKIIYIGKSINLFSRVNSYFNGKSKLNFAKKKMIGEIFDIKTIIVNNEKESLILETTLIKKHKPKYNILMKDDKNYIYVKITEEEIPKIIKTRIKNKSGIYFGPYVSTNYVNNVLKIVKKVFGYRSCNIEFNLVNDKNFHNKLKHKNIKIKNSNSTKIPCIDYYTKRCSAPCLLKDENILNYKKSIENIKNFFNGDYKNIYNDLNKKMLKKAKELKFEEANIVKKDIESLKILEENQIVREAVKGDFDIINYLEKYDKFYISLASIRDSKIIDLKNYEIETKLEETIDEILIEFIEREINLDGKQTIILPKKLQFLSEQNPFPTLQRGYKKEIKNGKNQKSNHLIKIDSLLNSSIPKIEIPKIGLKLDLLKFVYKNAYEFAYRKHLDSLSTKGFTKETMKNLLKILGYKELNKNLVFECNDISHLSGTYTVASRSVLENGKINKNKYRKFNIKSLENLKIDDFSSMREIITRRLKEILEKGNLPDLIIIDGGKGQLNAVLEVIKNFKQAFCPPAEVIGKTENGKLQKKQNSSKSLYKNGKYLENPELFNICHSQLTKLQLVSIAKKEEELFLPGNKKSINLEKDSQELRLIQKLRDEAHRFAISFNREKRTKSEKRNILESIPGIGIKTRSKLTKNYGNIDNLKNISKAELSKIISKRQIEALENHGII